MKSKGLEMGNTCKANREEIKKVEDFFFWLFQKMIFNHYDTILYHFDSNFTIFMLYGVKNETILQPTGNKIYDRGKRRFQKPYCA